MAPTMVYCKHLQEEQRLTQLVYKLLLYISVILS